MQVYMNTYGKWGLGTAFQKLDRSFSNNNDDSLSVFLHKVYTDMVLSDLTYQIST